MIGMTDVRFLHLRRTLRVPEGARCEDPDSTHLAPLRGMLRRNHTGRPIRVLFGPLGRQMGTHQNMFDVRADTGESVFLWLHLRRDVDGDPRRILRRWRLYLSGKLVQRLSRPGGPNLVAARGLAASKPARKCLISRYPY